MNSKIEDKNLRKLTKRIEDVRRKLDITPRRNVAAAQVQIYISNEASPIYWVETLIAVSGRKTLPGTVSLVPYGQFQTFSIPPGHDRSADTEYKLLEAIASRCDPQSSGVVDLVTERSPCPSCTFVIEQFRKRFPGIKLNIMDGQGQVY
jgi:hypothetical protein